MLFLIIIIAGFTPLYQCSLQGAIQLSCIREITEVPDVEQQALCQAFPFDCSTAESAPYCQSPVGVTEQPSTIPGVSQMAYSPIFSLSR